MKAELMKRVIAPLLEQGYTGKWPHFRSVDSGYIRLISFQTNKYGGSFTVECSVAFPETLNISIRDFQRINVSHTNQRYRLKGMYDGWFYYCDVYRKRTLFLGTHYLDVGEKNVSTFVPPKGYQLIQRFDQKRAEEICACVNAQLKNGFSWMDRYINQNGKGRSASSRSAKILDFFRG
jgi:hypothetical protein